MADLLGVCLWCSRDIVWDHCADGWRHTESNSLFCPDGSRAVIANSASRLRLTRTVTSDSAFRPAEAPQAARSVGSA
ncbi:MAG: hypothetical protein AUG44_27455 [Actinobacteria bacterium 13_1_20CM_3_71_11]|nr:MAG: hypothetical protein AUG44_27455 [Actinobacteria bacterium 13_1_20CM_3_71_11]